MVAFNRIALSTLALGGSVSARHKRECRVADHVKTVEAKPAQAATAAAFAISDFKPGVQWEIVIHEPIKHDSAADLIPSKAKVWDIDMGHAVQYPEIISLLKKSGKFVICYFNAGALQDWDDDKDKFPEAAIGHSLAYPYSSEEFYLDIRDATVLKLQKARLDVAAQIGCDAVDPDNVDAWQQDDEDPTGFKLKESDYTKYLKSLAQYAHSLKTKDGNPLLVGQKNAPEIAEDLVSTLDFAVLESCRGTTDPNEENWPFCEDFQIYIDAGKPVLQIEYPPSVEKTGKVSASDNTYYCTPKDEDKGFSKIIKWASAQLDGWGQYCGEEPFRTPVFQE
ncbi:hypothetical protein NW762_001090 [Fusarium torreyae]|uniref:alpha-galactosidase n=1 Tax=Fusarium torreyae TaxID=1237075 RepID=A0A9W8VP42_9HYPO|nr:hypothetical protein NW762_001090 [Fusarium torreyae]